MHPGRSLGRRRPPGTRAAVELRQRHRAGDRNPRPPFRQGGAGRAARPGARARRAAVQRADWRTGALARRFRRGPAALRGDPVHQPAPARELSRIEVRAVRSLVVPSGALLWTAGPLPGRHSCVEHRLPATILLVDDYPPNLTAIEAALEPLEQRLVKASSGAEALKFLLSEDSCALILLDVNMPGQDGFETADLIRARGRTRDIPILFMTAVKRPEGARQASEHGAADYIVRPVEPEVLRTKVRGILELRERNEELEQRLLRSAAQERAQRLAERRLERRYRTLVEATGQVVWSTAPAGDMVEDSPSWRAFTGQSAQELLGRGFLDAVHPQDRERAARAWQAGISGRRPHDLEFRLRRADG